MIINGDCLEVLKTFDAESIDSVITSPPYWQLRDYGWSGQWGLEKTYQEYLDKMIELMKELKRVLKPTGTMFINLGDSYGTVSGAMKDGKFGVKNTNNQQFAQPKSIDKSLLLIPHRFAIRCIDELGLILRNDIIWAKRNGMPESVKDRFSKKHEFIFFFVKSQKYYFDLDGVREKPKFEMVWSRKGSGNDTPYEGNNPSKRWGKTRPVTIGSREKFNFVIRSKYISPEAVNNRKMHIFAVNPQFEAVFVPMSRFRIINNRFQGANLLIVIPVHEHRTTETISFEVVIYAVLNKPVTEDFPEIFDKIAFFTTFKLEISTVINIILLKNLRFRTCHWPGPFDESFIHYKNPAPMAFTPHLSDKLSKALLTLAIRAVYTIIGKFSHRFSHGVCYVLFQIQFL